MTLAEDFQIAVAELKKEEDAFIPLLEKFDELKTIINANFRDITPYRGWFGKIRTLSTAAVTVRWEKKFAYKDECFLLIRIGYNKYVMGIETSGETKGRPYFIPDGYEKECRKELIFSDYSPYHTYKFYKEDVMTNVQLFARIIRANREYLINP